MVPGSMARRRRCPCACPDHQQRQRMANLGRCTAGLVNWLHRGGFPREGSTFRRCQTLNFKVLSLISGRGDGTRSRCFEDAESK